MNCEEANALFSEYIDHELPQDRLREFEEHLAACAGCREEFRIWKEADVALSDVLDTEAVPGVLLDAFVAKCNAEAAYKPGMLTTLAQWLSVPRRRVVATVAGSMALTALLMMLVSAGTSRPITPNKVECSRLLNPRGCIALERVECLTEGGSRNDL